MSFPQARERLQASVFARLGEDALWGGAAEPVRVRFAEKDEVASFGQTDLMLATLVLRVRRSEVEAPSSGDVVELILSGRRLRVTAEPRLDANGVWAIAVTDA